MRPPLNRRIASARVAFQRQRAANIGAGSSACVRHLFDACRLDELEDRIERKGVLIGQREDDAVVGRRGLQLEIERAAEALAQRESPRAVDARAERRVQDQLHPAAFIEESFGDDRAFRRNDAENRLAGAHVRHRLLRAGAIERAFVARATRARRASSRSSIALRTAQTSRESSIVRPSPSPFQNGIDGGAPCASSTRTTPASTRRILHEFVPSKKMSPAMLSIAKSSSSVPTTCPSGSSDHVVVRGVGNRAAAGDRGEPRAAARDAAVR